MIENHRHPKTEEKGALYWRREGFWWVCGDRVRHTVILVMPDGVLEMTPGAATALADEMLCHAADVRDDSADNS